MRLQSSVGILAGGLLLLGLPTPALLADDAATAAAGAAALSVQVVEDGEGDDVYVVHDEVFVEERGPDVPGSDTIAAKLPLSLAETPLAIATVDAPALEVRDVQVLGDALETTSGVHVQSGNGIFDALMLRGLDTTANGLILTDGAPEPQTAYFQLYNVERVEVLKGPSSFLYGGSSMAGAVNLVRKQPRPGDFVDLGVSGGSFSTFQGTLDANHYDASGRWGLRFNGQWWETDGYRDKAAESFGVNPAFAFRASDKTTVHVSLEYLATDADPDAGLPLLFNGFGYSVPTNVPRKQVYDAPFSRSEQDTYRFQVDVETRFTDDFLLRNKTYYRSLDWLSDTTSLDGITTAPFSPPRSPLVVARTQLTLDDRQRFAGNQLEALWRVGSGEVRHNLLFGVEVAERRDEFTFNVGLLGFVDLLDPVETQPGVLAPLLAFGTDSTATIVAPYVVDQVHVSDKVQVLLGVRLDDIDFEDALTGLERSDSQVSPTAGVVVTPREGFSFYLNAGQAFTPPSTFVVGESREPEESEQVELGFRFARADGKLAASLAVYRLDRDHVAIPDQTGVTQQTGTQRNDGVELEVSAELRRGLRATLAYAWTDAELTEFTQQSFFIDPRTGQVVPVTVDLSGNKAAWVPENLVSLWLSQQLPRGWGVAAGGRWVDDQFIAPDNLFAVGDFVMVDAAIWFGRDPWRFQVNLDNLTDKETYTRAFAGNSVIPAPGFAARAGLRYRF